jgi:hypothetical protein
MTSFEFFLRDIDVGLLEKIGPTGIFYAARRSAEKILRYSREDFPFLFSVVLSSIALLLLHIIPLESVSTIIYLIIFSMIVFSITIQIIIKIWKSLKKNLDNL